jgi:hypothetical protein
MRIHRTLMKSKFVDKRAENDARRYGENRVRDDPGLGRSRRLRSASPTIPASLAGHSTRIGLWVGAQLVVAGLMIASGAIPEGQALNAPVGRWIVYAGVIDIGTLGVIGWLIRRPGHAISYRSPLGPPAAVWQIGSARSACCRRPCRPWPLVRRSPTRSTGRHSYRCSPSWPSLSRTWTAPAVAGTAYRPVLAGRAGRGRHLGRRACVRPLLTGDGGLDLVFAGYRLVSVLPFLAVCTVLYYAFGRRVLPIMVARWGLQRRLGSGALNLVE